MRLWDWALAAYARRGVAPACLALQDDHGQNVPFLLWAAWAGPVDAALLAQAAGLARDWEAGVGAPLRQARRALKPSRPPVSEAARKVLREDIKAVELAAEKLLLDSLEQITPRTAGAGDLGAASAAWGTPAPAEALEALAAALS